MNMKGNVLFNLKKTQNDIRLRLILDKISTLIR